MPEHKGGGAIAIIPARSGSKRIIDKNIRVLNGSPLLAYSVNAAHKSGLFERVILATDSARYADIGSSYGAEVPSLRPPAISGDKSPDIEWISWAISEWGLQTYTTLTILRPTSPLRTSEDIRSCHEILSKNSKLDSVRAVSKASIHPGKMWSVGVDSMNPLMPFYIDGVPWHSSQTANLPEIYYQNASLEVVKLSSLERTGKISGDVIAPFFSSDLSGFDINTPLDIEFLEFLIASGKIKMPALSSIK